MRLKDRIALITGAAGDIGAAVARRFAEEGAAVMLSDINDEGCRRVLDGILEAGGRGSILRADVTREDDVLALFSGIRETYGRLDILAPIAGGDFENQVSVDEIS